LGLRGLNADVSNRKQIGHCFQLFQGDLLHSLDVSDSIMESIDDFDVLDVWDSVPDVAETFHVVPKTFIMLLLDALSGFCCR
jgi:hypothetical protein